MQISTMEQLLLRLSSSSTEDYSDILHHLAIPNSVFEQFCSWSAEGYTRNCILENDQFELLLLCWESGQTTPIHDHGGEECWVKVIKGQFKERIYNCDANQELTEIRSRVSNQGEVSYMVDFMGCHSLENLSTGRSLSLHLYAKPIKTCKAYDEELGSFVSKKLVYNTISDLEIEVNTEEYV